MKTKNQILKGLIGETLEQGRLQSFYLNGELVSLINVTFLKFGTWIKFVSGDERSSVLEVEDGFENLDGYGDTEFHYPLAPMHEKFPEFANYYGKKLLDVKELFYGQDESASYGFNFYFDGGVNIILHDKPYPEDENEFIFDNIVPKGLNERTRYNNL